MLATVCGDCFFCVSHCVWGLFFLLATVCGDCFFVSHCVWGLFFHIKPLSVGCPSYHCVWGICIATVCGVLNLLDLPLCVLYG